MTEKREGLIRAMEAFNRMNEDSAVKAAETTDKILRRKYCLAMVHCETSLASIRKKLAEEDEYEKSD